MSALKLSRTDVYNIAMAAGKDAGNRSAKAAGRPGWAPEDRDAAVAEMDRVMDAHGMAWPFCTVCGIDLSPDYRHERKGPRR